MAFYARQCAMPQSLCCNGFFLTIINQVNKASSLKPGFKSYRTSLGKNENRNRKKLSKKFVRIEIFNIWNLEENISDRNQ